MQNLREVYASLTESERFKKEVDRAKKEFEVKPFVKEFFRLKNIVKILKPILNLFSIVLAWGFLFYQFSTNLDVYVSAVLAAVALIFLELIKNEVCQTTFYRIYTTKFGSLQSALILVSGTLLIGSAYTSVLGAKEMYQHLDKSKNRLEANFANKSDSISGYYDKQIKSEKEALASFKNSVSWEGKINIYNPTTAKAIENHENRISLLTTQKNEALSRLNATSDMQSSVLEEKTGFNIMFWLAVSGINELLIILSIWFLIWFDFRTDQEAALFSPAGTQMTLDLDGMSRMFQMFLMNNGNIAHLPLQSELSNGMETGGIGFGNNNKSNESQIGFQIPKKSEVGETNGVQYRYVEGKGFLVKCPKCGKETYRKSVQAKFCGDGCRRKFHQEAITLGR